MPKKLEMFVFITGPIAFTPFHQVNKNSCRVHQSYSVSMFRTQRTGISIMSKV